MYKFTHSEIPVKGKSMAGPMVKETEKGFKSAPVYLKSNCFISAGAVILPGITIGEGFDSGCKFCCDQRRRPWTIVMGIPAKKKGKRIK